MTSNHEEYNNDITLEILKCSVQIYWGSTYLCRKSDERNSFEVVSNLVLLELAFSNLL